MIISETQTFNQEKICSLIWQVIFVFILTFLAIFTVYSQQNPAPLNNENVITVDEIKDGEIFAFGKTVVVKKGVKGVLVFGGDLIVEGRIEEDAAVIGGSIIQKDQAFIGGDVIIFGGKYQHEKLEPLRNSDKETIMYAGYEEELRNITQNPTQIFSPQLTWSFLIQRLLSVIFWFLATLAVTTIAPGAVSRAVAGLQLSLLKIVGLGMLAFFVITIFVITSLSYLPTNFSGIIGIVSAITILLAYFFGRISLNVSLGKSLQKRILPERFQSESLAIFIGTIFWVGLLSIPYLGNVAVVLLFASSLGLIITARSNINWN
jgi:hypothetical protein